MIISKHIIRRQILQARTASPVATTATAAAAGIAYVALQVASWRPAAAGSANLPPHNWAQSGLQDFYDACKYCGDFDAATMRQHAYACAADYVIKVPDDAQTGDPCDLVSLAVRAHGDRWLAGGAIVAAIPSASATPPAWADVLAAATAYGPVMAVVPSNTGTDSAADVTLTFPAATAATACIHLVIRLADYTAVRGAWIEGSAMLAESSIAVEYSRDVVADPIATPVALPTRTLAFPSLQTADGVLHFGGEFGLAWYSSTVASPISRATELAREMSIKQALAQFPYAAKVAATEMPAAPAGAGIRYAESGVVDDVRVDGAVMALFYHAQQPRAVSRFTLLSGMPGLAETGWHDGLHIRWAVYHVAGAWESDALSPVSLRDPLFWRGTAASVTFLTAGVDRVVAATPVASLVMPDGGYANGDTIPILLTALATRGTFLMAWHPEDVTDHGIPAAMDTFYGIDFTGQIPQALFME